jgi:Sortase domain
VSHAGPAGDKSRAKLWWILTAALLVFGTRIHSEGPPRGRHVREDPFLSPPIGRVDSGVVRAPHGAKRWWLAAVTMLVIGAGIFTLGIRGEQHALAGPVASVAKAQFGDTALEPTKAGPLLAARSVPVTLSVPAISLNVSLSSLGLNSDGTVQVPTDIQQPGWFRLGPTPGQAGSAVILGHVDSYQGPAVFFNLRTLVAGDQVNVTLADGAITHFDVTSVAMFTKTQFPDQQVYAPHSYSALQLVTCGGAFDSATGHYLSNIVVFTTLTSVTPAPTSAGA